MQVSRVQKSGFTGTRVRFHRYWMQVSRVRKSGFTVTRVRFHRYWMQVSRIQKSGFTGTGFRFHGYKSQVSQDLTSSKYPFLFSFTPVTSRHKFLLLLHFNISLAMTAVQQSMLAFRLRQTDRQTDRQQPLT